MSFYTENVKITKEMQEFMGLSDAYASCVDVMRYITTYVKDHKLHGDDEYRIDFVPDETLGKLLGTTQRLTFTSLNKFVMPHFINNTYTVKVKFMDGEKTGETKEYTFDNVSMSSSSDSSTSKLSTLICYDLPHGLRPPRIKLVKNDKNDKNDSENVDYLVYVKHTEDYPFTKWDSFFEAFTVSMQTEFGVEHAPVYDKLLKEKGGVIDIEIMEDLLEKGNNPQEGLKGLITALLDGCRYSHEVIPSFRVIIEKMVKKGAFINTDILSMMTIPKFSRREQFESEMGNLVKAKGYLLNMLFTFEGVETMFHEMILPYQWSQINPVYYEDMIATETVGECNGHEMIGHLLGSHYNYLESYYSALKHEMNV